MYQVMIVEDEALERKGLILTTQWDAYGYQVIGEAKNGQEGMERILELKPDLIFTDIKMPLMDGITMLQNIREVYEPAVIILTAFNEFELAKQAIKLGVVDFLLKPFNDEELEQALNKAKDWLDRRLQQPTTQVRLPSMKHLLEEGSNSRRYYLQKAIAYLHEHYAMDLSLRDVAEVIGISESHLSHLFREETSYTFLEVLTNTRMRKACELLKDPSVRIYEVARAIGYKDQRYFSSLFKRMIGMSPLEYKEKNIL